MLNEQTFQLLASMRMHGLARALQEQLKNADYQKLSFDILSPC